MDSRSHNLPGQATLTGLESEVGYLSITHLKPQQEAFAEEFVLNGGNSKQAYLKAYPGTKYTSAKANSCRLLKTEQIQQRIAEIRAELQRRYSVDAQGVVRLLAMSMGVDRRLFLKEDGTPADLHDLPAEAAAITDIQIVLDRNGKKHAIPVIPERIKAAIELAKIMGITKDKIEVSGTTAGRADVCFYIPSNGRDAGENPDVERFANLRAIGDRFKKHKMTEQIENIRNLSETHGTTDIRSLLEKLETVAETLE